MLRFNPINAQFFSVTVLEVRTRRTANQTSAKIGSLVVPTASASSRRGSAMEIEIALTDQTKLTAQRLLMAA